MSTVIEIEHLYKEYRLGLIGYGTLREDLQSWWARARGKEDPNSMLFSSDQSRDGRVLDHILALNDINLEVKQGERVGIIGANGAGKTTLLKILAHIASPTKGTVRIKGRVASLLAVGTGMHGELTGRENIYLNGAILGLRKFEIDKRFDEIVDFSGVEQFIDTPTKRYSSGMGVRLGFAVAAHLDPDVLIVDEVLAVGDAEFRKKALGKMKEASEEEGRTILFVSHNMSAISKLCDRAILLEKGSVIMDGKSGEVIDFYLSSFSSGKSQMSWNDHENAPGNDTLRLKSARILSIKGEHTNQINIRDDFLIEITYWNLKEGTKMWVGIHVFTSSDIHVLASQNAHSESIQQDSFWDTPQPAGLYRTVCRVPGRLFNHGTYLVNVTIGINVFKAALHEVRLLEFTIVDTISEFQKKGKPHGGIIRPLLGWETETLDPAMEV